MNLSSCNNIFLAICNFIIKEKYVVTYIKIYIQYIIDIKKIKLKKKKKGDRRSFNEKFPKLKNYILNFLI